MNRWATAEAIAAATEAIAADAEAVGPPPRPLGRRGGCCGRRRGHFGSHRGHCRVRRGCCGSTARDGATAIAFFTKCPTILPKFPEMGRISVKNWPLGGLVMPKNASGGLSGLVQGPAHH